MADNIFAAFAATVDEEALNREVEAALENKGDYKDVPDGEFEVKLVSLSPGFTKDNTPKMQVDFQIILPINKDHDEFKNHHIFIHQKIDTGFGISKAINLLNQFKSGVDIKYTNLQALADLIVEVEDAVKRVGTEFKISQKTGKSKAGKEFKEFEILAVYDQK